MTARIRLLQARDLWQVLAIEREAFPEDPWTTETARGWLSRSVIGRPRHAARLARVLQLIRLGEWIHLVQLMGVVAFRRPAALYYVVAVTDQVAGFGRLKAGSGPRADIQTIAVRREFEGQGIGTALLNDLIAAATARECHEVFLYVRADNDRARRLYRRAGFTDLGLWPAYYQPSGTDAIVMCRPGPDG